MISFFSQDSYDQLISLPNDTLRDKFDYYVSSLCMWGRCDAILERIVNWLPYETSGNDPIVLREGPVSLLVLLFNDHYFYNTSIIFRRIPLSHYFSRFSPRERQDRKRLTYEM